MNHFRTVTLWAAATLLTGTLGSAADRMAPALPSAAQEAELRLSLAQTAAVIAGTGDALVVSYPVRLAFQPDSDTLRSEGLAMLDLLARSLRRYPGSQVLVAVYSDALGGTAFNLRQAQARAGAVAAYLQTRGVAPDRLEVRKGGPTQLLPAENTPEGRDLNRRLELTIAALSS